MAEKFRIEPLRDDAVRNTALVCALAVLTAAAWFGYTRVERARLANDPEHVMNRFRVVGGM